MVRAWGKWNQWSSGTVRRMAGSAVALTISLASCGGTVVEGTEPPADVPDECIGDYEGSFSGDLRGRLTGSLDANAGFTVTFVQSGNGQSATGSGNIAEDGGIEVLLGPNSVTGRFKFDRCRATGDWVAGEARGSWNATLK
ncbi:MAG TPA: hypothetical protein VFU02_05300 [Polyangiaceae bacterium]|nr:hypothetical protein [Polyangiaceae bacterium]